MQPEEYIQRNIDAFSRDAEKGMVFGPSCLQRTCRISYNQAMHTIDEMKERGLIVSGSKPWNYRWV